MSGASSERYAHKASKGKKKADLGGWLGFVDIPLSGDDRARLLTMNWSEETALSFLEECVNDGYKVSIVQDPAHACVIASLTGREHNFDNAGYTLSGRGPDFMGGLASLYYKHVVLCERGRWSAMAIDPGPADSWG